MKHIMIYSTIGLLAVNAFAASKLTFDTSGEPTSLVLGGVEFLNSKSSGFNLRYSNGRDVTNTRLSKISTSGNKIRVSHPEGMPNFTFQIDTYPNHLAIHLLDAQGIGTGRNYSLSLELDSEDVAAYTLNDLMTTNAGNQRRRGRDRDRDRGNNTVVSWPYLWGRPRPNGTRGSVVLYNNNLSGSARDAVLAEIWSAQGTAGHMVRPAGRATWTQADVLAWVDRWVAKFSKIATVSVSAENKAELYKMTDTYVLPSGANRVYMFCPVWRGEYKLNYLSMVDVNRDVFPNGKSDLVAYSEYLAKHGAHLQLKSLGPQIGRNDERYISSSSVDRRLMRWCTGTLAEDVAPSATTIRFRLGPEPMLRMRTEGPMRLGNEIISAGRIRRTDDVWVLENCERGYGASSAKSHRAGTEMQGIVLSNNVINFEDDFGLPNSIAEEICGEYGDFLNELNVGHLHFDGSGRMHIYPWYVRDFTDYIYSRVDQPVTGSTVGGGIEANFEKRFSKAKAISGATAYHLVRIGPRLHERGRRHTELAPSMLDLHFDVSDGIRIGSRRPTFCGGQSGKLLSMETLNNYGLTDYAFGLFKYWVELAPVFDDADADYVAGFLQKGGNHYMGEDVLVLSKNDDGDYIYTPHRVMGRTSGKDPLIRIDQEWGAVPRFQNIKAGTTLELLNPYEKQEPQVVIRVEHGSKALRNPLIKVNGKGGLAVKGEIQPNEYMKFEGANTVNVYDNNWNLLRTLPAITESFTVNKGNNTVTTAAASGTDTPDLRVQFITLGPVYVLESNKHLSDTFSTAYFEAEHFTSQTGGNKASTEYFPYIGDGYLEMGGQGATVTWNNITVPKAGKYTLILKYANNTQQDRPCDLKVNGALIKNIPLGPFLKNWFVPRPEATEYNPETVGWAKYWNARVIVDLEAGANTLELIATSEEGGPHIDNIGVSTAVSEPPAPIINVKDHGAVGDGSTDNTEAIANAITACPAGGSVVFDEGVYMTGSITLKANMTLWVSENAVIRAFQDNSKIQTYPEGAFTGGYITKYFLFGNQVDNLTITGGGTIDGNTTGRLPGRSNTRRPTILGWVNSQNVTVTNVDLLNGDFWAFVPQKSDRVIIDGINLFNLNKDGIAPVDCHDISITNSVISSGDDAMVPKSYDPSKGIDNLVVKNLTINYTKWKGIKYGGSTRGDFTNSIFEDIAMVHTHSGLALYAMSGCNVTNIKFNRIRMNNVQTPFFIIRDVARSTDTPGMRDIYISNFEVRNVYGQEGSSIQGTERNGTVYPVKNIHLANVSVKDFRGGLDAVPETPREFPGRYPETTVFGTFPAWGYYIRHAENVVFTNVTHDVSPEDAREAIVLEDVTGFKTVGLGNPSFSRPNNK